MSMSQGFLLWKVCYYRELTLNIVPCIEMINWLVGWDRVWFGGLDVWWMFGGWDGWGVVKLSLVGGLVDWLVGWVW